MQLQIETVAHCNAACVFCPYPAMVRPKGIMAQSLFEKIVVEGATHAAIDHFTLTGLGETLIDPRIVERIAFIRKTAPHAMVDLYTNGSLLTEKVTRGLIDAGISVIYVSLNAVRAEQRKQIMKLDDFDAVVAYCDRAIELAEGTRTKIVIKAVREKDLFYDDEPEQFMRRWGGPWDQPGGHAFLHLEGNWAGAQYPVRVIPTAACIRALTEIMVLWDGRVSLCCFDGEGEVIFGDLNHQTIKEIYNGPAALEYRTAHVEGRRGEMALCRTCTAI